MIIDFVVCDQLFFFIFV